MGWEDVVAFSAASVVVGAIIGNTRLAASVISDIWEYLRTRPTRTKRLEQTVGGISDMLPEMKATLDDMTGKVDALSKEMPRIKAEIDCRTADHRYVEDGLEALMFGMLTVLDKTPGNGEVADAKRRIKDFVSVRHR